MSRFRELRKKANLTQEELIAQFNARYNKKYTAAAISKFEHDKRIPATESLKDFAEFFGVSVGYLLGMPERDPAPAARPAASASARERRDERDVQRRLESIREDLANADGLAFMGGEQMTEEDREILLDAIESGLRTAKRLAKKYTPKKYREDGK